MAVNLLTLAESLGFPIEEMDQAKLDALNTDGTPRTAYSKTKARREEASFEIMMHIDSDNLIRIRNEFRNRGEEVTLEEFVYVMKHHLLEAALENMPEKTRQAEFGKNFRKSMEEEFSANMIELFLEVDVNGDGYMEWDEFTRFVVEKAGVFKQKLAVGGLAEYYDASAAVDASSRYKHRNHIAQMCVIPRYHQFAVLEQHKPVVWIYNARTGREVTHIPVQAVPHAVTYVEDMEQRYLVTSCADNSMVCLNLDDPMPARRYTIRNSWAAPTPQMSLCWSHSHSTLYSGSAEGEVYAWNMDTHTQLSCNKGHSDVIMEIIDLANMDNLVTASLDTTIGVWDSFTSQQVLRLSGHRKGVFGLSYNAEHRLLVSAGFDHDAYIWSPFVNSLVYKLKGHHSTLVGCHCVEGTPEIITADSSGLFKLWDIRTFQCVNTFTTAHTPGSLTDLSGITSFAHIKLPPQRGDSSGDGSGNQNRGGRSGGRGFSNPDGKTEEDFRIIAATKRITFFDQHRQQMENASADGTLSWIGFNTESMTVGTVVERGVCVWDALLGSVKRDHRDMSVADITEACFDDRQRKLFIGDATGDIRVLNYGNGAVMKMLRLEESVAAMPRPTQANQAQKEAVTASLSDALAASTSRGGGSRRGASSTVAAAATAAASTAAALNALAATSGATAASGSQTVATARRVKSSVKAGSSNSRSRGGSGTGKGSRQKQRRQQQKATAGEDDGSTSMSLAAASSHTTSASMTKGKQTKWADGKTGGASPGRPSTASSTGTGGTAGKVAARRSGDEDTDGDVEGDESGPQKHSTLCEVVGLQYVPKHKAVLAAYRTGVIQVVSDEDMHHCPVLRTFDLHYSHEELTNCVLDQKLWLIATSGADPHEGIRIWDFYVGKCEMEFHPQLELDRYMDRVARQAVNERVQAARRRRSRDNNDMEELLTPVASAQLSPTPGSRLGSPPQVGSVSVRLESPGPSTGGGAGSFMSPNIRPPSPNADVSVRGSRLRINAQLSSHEEEPAGQPTPSQKDEASVDSQGGASLDDLCRQYSKQMSTETEKDAVSRASGTSDGDTAGQSNAEEPSARTKSIQAQKTMEILAMVFLSPYPVLLTTDTRGNVHIWGVKYCAWKGSLLFEFENTVPDHAEREEPFVFDLLEEGGSPGSPVSPLQPEVEAMSPTSRAKVQKEAVARRTRARMAEAVDTRYLRILPGHEVYEEEDSDDDSVYSTSAAAALEEGDDDGDLGADEKMSKPDGQQSTRSQRTTPIVDTGPPKVDVGTPKRHAAEQAKQHKAPGKRDAQRRRAGKAGESDFPMPEIPPMPITHAERGPNPIQCASWDATECAVYVGDEGGNVRKWGLKRVMRALGIAKVDCKHEDEQTGVSGSHHTTSTDLSPLASPMLHVQQNMRGNNMFSFGADTSEPFAPIDSVDFRWSVAGHEEAVMLLSLIAKPRVLLTAGGDRCVRMWNRDGGALGVLLQGVPRKMHSPEWNLPFDVESRVAAENALISEVNAKVEDMRQRAIAESMVGGTGGAAAGGAAGGRRRSDAGLAGLTLPGAADVLQQEHKPDRPLPSRGLGDERKGLLTGDAEEKTPLGTADSGQPLLLPRATDDRRRTASRGDWQGLVANSGAKLGLDFEDSVSVSRGTAGMRPGEELGAMAEPKSHSQIPLKKPATALGRARASRVRAALHEVNVLSGDSVALMQALNERADWKRKEREDADNKLLADLEKGRGPVPSPKGRGGAGGGIGAVGSGAGTGRDGTMGSSYRAVLGKKRGDDGEAGLPLLAKSQALLEDMRSNTEEAAATAIASTAGAAAEASDLSPRSLSSSITSGHTFTAGGALPYIPSSLKRADIPPPPEALILPSPRRTADMNDKARASLDNLNQILDQIEANDECDSLFPSRRMTWADFCAMPQSAAGFQDDSGSEADASAAGGSIAVSEADNAMRSRSRR